jgi:hypothetical protein
VICVKCCKALGPEDVKVHVEVVAHVPLPPELEPIGRSSIAACVACSPYLLFDLVALVRRLGRQGENDRYLA